MQDLYKDEQLVSDYRTYEILPKVMSTIVINRAKMIKNIDCEHTFDLMLDAGCGSGASTRIFTNHFKKIIGFDISPQQIELAKKIDHGKNISYVVGSGSKLPAEDNSVDVIVSSFAAHYFDTDEFVDECKRVLKDGGCVALMGNSYRDIEMLGGRRETKPTKKFADEFFKKAAEYFREHIPGEADLLLEYQPIFDRIKGIKKEKIDNILHAIELSLEFFKNHILSIPDYRKFTAHEVNSGRNSSLDDLIANLKKCWNVEDIGDDQIQVKLTVSIFMIFLIKK